MRHLWIFFVICLVAGQTASSSDSSSYTDDNTAFFEGEKLTYVVYPPGDYRMIIDQASDEGYSFAFIPPESDYTAAEVMVGVNIYKIRGIAFEDALAQDTAGLREHYGAEVSIRAVDSIFTGSGEMIPTFYVNDAKAFIPNVMISYYDGATEMLIFELIISPTVARFEAEEVFMECLERFKALPMGDLGYE
ncbi:MAG: hypothetical protein GY867_01185 [bacterium]|nr:hypothetical protein [bacterium]